MKTLIILLFIASIASITSQAAQIICGGIGSTCCISSDWETGGWIYLISVGLSIIFLSFSIIYMSSKIFDKPEWVVWIKDEFSQAVISVVIVVTLVIVLGAICYIFNNLAGGDPFQIAHGYLNEVVWDKTINFATTAFQDSLICQLVAGYKTQMGQSSLGVTFHQSAGLKLVATDLDFLYALFAGLSASLMVQDIGLSIIQAFAFRIMLPLGILFRVFPFLRKAGAMLIALSIGLYIVFPLCFVMDKAVVDSVINQPGFQNSLIMNVAQLQTIGVSTIVLSFISPFLPWALIDLVWLMAQAALLLPQAIFLPTLNLVITLTFVKNAARVLSQNFGEG
ncbi:hypothetical protein H0N98_00650 [Candidatus Micrarchaeota archaeon]|nr:hypothetical protein [Candidatus Micrarchaeota archaeon]